MTPIKLETGLRPNSAGIPYALLLRIEAIGFPTVRHLLYYLYGYGRFTRLGRRHQTTLRPSPRNPEPAKRHKLFQTSLEHLSQALNPKPYTLDPEPCDFTCEPKWAAPE